MPRFLITSALPYINGVKHLGNLAGSMLPADVYARFLRARGEEVLFVCGTDEHGTPAELAAEEAGLEVAEYCRRQYEIQAELGRRFGLSFDHFGRSSSPQNTELTQHFARALEANGLLEERTVEQLYSPSDGRFLPDRYVVGTCPICAYERARGDQCENCTTLLDPTDLIEPRSALSGSTNLEIRETRHLFLLQSRLASEIEQWLDTKHDWPILVTSIARKWLTEGIADRSITRDLDWGIPVPFEGFEDKVFYVWFDAPIEYIAATKEWADEGTVRDWRSWWWQSDDVHYVQFMAKDNIPFHTIGFPTTLIGSREPWHLVNYIKGFNWLTYYGGKFSSSQQIGVFMSDALELLPADYWRYYLLARAPESGDSSFTWEDFAVTVNKGLADTLGNFVNRTVQFTLRQFGQRVPAGGEPGPEEASLERTVRRLVASYERYLETMRFRKAVETLRDLWRLGNNYLETRAPWEHKDDVGYVAVTLRTALNFMGLICVLSEPVIPETAGHLVERLGLQRTERTWPTVDGETLARLPPGAPFAVPDVLFAKVSTEQVDDWKRRFGGHEP